MKDNYSAEEFRKLLNNGTIKISKKRLKMDSNELLLKNEQSTTIDNKVSKNEDKKVRNAKKILHDGMMFDSSLNIQIYEFLKSNHIKFEREVKYELQPSFKKFGITYRNLTWTACIS